MKKLLLLLPLLALGGCAYQSMAEAMAACQDWKYDESQVTQRCKKKQPWHEDCISSEEREARINALKKANTVDGIIDLKAVSVATKKIPQGITYVFSDTRECSTERDTKQVLGLEDGKGIVRRFRY